jgi:hypothetical protein
MGAMQNRCDNILILFRFIVLFGIAGFWADGNSKLTVEAFSFRFKCLIGSSARLSTMLRIVRYGVAVPDELVQYRDVAPHVSTFLVDPPKFRRKVTRCPPRA